MLILFMMLLIGLFAGIWGFTACFLPAQWDRLTEGISFADRWTVPSAKPIHPIIRLGYRGAGVVICVVGCWFAYVAASGIYRLLTGRAVVHAVTQQGRLHNSPMILGNLLSLFVIVIGAAMAFVPARVVKSLELIWPTRRSITLPAPKIMLFVRVLGIIFTLLAIMFLMR